MTHTYHITGMTCDNCVAKVKSELLTIGEITEATVQLASPQATISMQRHLTTDRLQTALQNAGNFVITAADSGMQHEPAISTKPWLAIYKPILLIFMYILLVTGTVAVSANGIDWMTAMRVFMSGFFLAFSFFKMLDLKGFAESYATYDILAKIFPGWGIVYAFIELFLGISFALNLLPVITNLITLVVMTISIIGVLQSVLNKRKIQCACLGTIFNLPMSTVTIIEDGLMIVMSGAMLVVLL